MNYGADGNDYFQFTNPSMAFDKESGFNTLITFAMHVNADGTLVIGGGAVCSNGIYIGPANWGALVSTLKTAPTTVTRYEVCIGGWQDTSYNNIENLVASQGTGTGSMLYKNFQCLKQAVPGIDAINDDDELTYDLNSSAAFANMLGGLGFKFSLVPYTAQGFWVALKNSITNCDNIYLQCYEGGAGNDPGQWNAAFGNGVEVIPGQESNTSNPATFHGWFLETGVQGGFYYPDVVFNSTYWSAEIIEGYNVVPPAPTGVIATPGGAEAVVSWNTAPGATSYNVKRSAISGGEIPVAVVSAIANGWPACNEYTDTGLAPGTTCYYEISAVNTNGESANSSEGVVTPQAGLIVNRSFETDIAAIGSDLNSAPAGWTPFNNGGSADIGSQSAGGIDYTIFNPLAAPAAGNQYCFVNMLSSGVPGGVFQDTGPLRANTIYTLTVAIGSRADRINSPGIVSLVNGTNYAGTILAGGGGLPAVQNTWQNCTVTYTTGASVSGDLTVVLSVLGNANTIQADFDNVRLTAAAVPPTTPPTSVSVTNFSFETNVAGGPGSVVASAPSGWRAFNEGHSSDIGSQWAGGSDYTTFNPLAVPAAGNQYCYVNMFNPSVTGGLYQDVGALAPDTVYSLTVAIGSRHDRINSPGIISLINGTNNLGTVLASGGGLPSAQNTWQNYSVTYVTGPSVNGDLTIAVSAVGNATTIQADFDNVRLTRAPLLIAPVLGRVGAAGGNLIISGSGGSPNLGYTLLAATNLSPPIFWITNSIGALDATGAFSNAIPINTSLSANYFRLRVP